MIPRMNNPACSTCNLSDFKALQMEVNASLVINPARVAHNENRDASPDQRCHAG